MAKLRTLLEPSLLSRDAENLQFNLATRIVGQDAAVAAMVDQYQVYSAGMCSGERPIGSFLFLGPTGTGKTHCIEALADSLLGSPKSMLKVDCAEYQHSHEVAKIIGSPPGYLGHRETHPIISQEIINSLQTDKVKLALILFDEIEKASDALWNLLLGILDKGTLSLGSNQKVNMSRCMIFLTSNLGSREMEKAATGYMGLAPMIRNGGDLSRIGVNAARKRFTPEFLNRIDKTVVFNPLSESDLRHILELELRGVGERVISALAHNAFSIRITEEAKRLLLAEGYDPRYGARHLKRSVETMLVAPLSRLIASRQINGMSVLVVGRSGTGLTFSKEPRGDSMVA